MGEPRLIDVTDSPDVVRLIREVARDGDSVLLALDDGTLAMLVPAVGPADARHVPAEQPDDDALLSLIGLGASDEPTDIANHRHEYVAQALDAERP